MLTYQQFVSRHPVKYKGLTRAQKLQRYQDYTRSQNDDNTGRIRQDVPRRRNRRRATRRPGGQNTSSGNVPAFLKADNASKYLALYARPFDTDTVGLPVFPSPPSSKQVAWARGTLTVGTIGNGFIVGGPTTVSDCDCFWFTGGSFTGSDTFVTSGTGVTAQRLTNLPVTTAALTADTGIRGRVSLCAVRIRYTGTQQNLGGTIYPFVHPLHQDLANQNTSWLYSQEEFTSFPVTRDWVTIVWVPVHRTECDYYHTVNPPTHNAIDTSGSNTTMGLLIKSTAGNTFEFHCVQHIEYTGPSSLTQTPNNITVNLSETVDRLQDPKLAIRANLRGVGAPRRDFRPLMEMISTAASTGAKALASAVVQRMRDEL